MERRCPSCGALVAADAEWCGQCFAPLSTRRVPEEAGSGAGPPWSGVPAPDRSTPVAGPAVGRRPGGGAPGPAGSTGAVRAEGSSLVWSCPACGTENPLDERRCAACGTPFGALFDERADRAPPPPGRAVGLSLLFPGLGHMAGGRAAEGVARAIVFLWCVAVGIAGLLFRGPVGGGILVPIAGLHLLVGAALYALTAADAGRLARGDAQIVTARMMTYAILALIVSTAGLLSVAAFRAGAAS